MESMDLEMDDIFDRGGDDADNDGEDYGVHAGLPDLDLDEGVMRPLEDQHGEQNEDDEVLNNLKNLSKGAAKKKVQRPQPKLDPERLKSDRGLPVLTKLFKDTQFKGKGHEVDDLRLVMGKLEHWAHRLYPKMPFDDFIERLERLGGKKEIQTCVKRIRLDMPILDEDFVSRQDEETKGSDNDNAFPDVSDTEDPVDAELAYDEMIRKEREAQDLDSRTRDNSLNSGRKPTVEPSTPIQPSSMSANSSPSFPSSVPNSSQKASEQVSTEQQERMERNRLQALQKRAQRLGVPIPTSLSQASASNVPSGSQPSANKSVCLNGKTDHLNADSCLANNLTTEDSINRIKGSSQQQLLSVETAALGNAEQCSGANNDIDENLGTKLSNPADKNYLESVTSNAFGQETMQTEDEILESLDS